MVTSILAKFSARYQPGAAFSLAVVYALEITYFHAEPSEDFVAHCGTLNLGGAIENVSWELLSTIAYIGGNELGPTFGRPGDIPGIGDIPLRDRHAVLALMATKCSTLGSR